MAKVGSAGSPPPVPTAPAVTYAPAPQVAVQQAPAPPPPPPAAPAAPIAFVPTPPPPPPPPATMAPPMQPATATERAIAEAPAWAQPPTQAPYTPPSMATAPSPPTMQSPFVPEQGPGTPMNAAPPSFVQAPAPIPAPAPATVAAPEFVNPAPVNDLSAAMASLLSSQAQMAGGLGAIDMGAVLDMNFRLVPEQIDIESVVVRVDKKTFDSGNDGFVLHLRTTFPLEHAGVTLRDNVVLTANALWKFKSLCRATGLLSEDGKRFIGQSEQDFVEYVLRHQIKHEVYNGEARNKIAGAYSEGYQTPGLFGAGGGGMAPPNIG